MKPMNLDFMPQITPAWLLVGSFIVSFISSIIPVVSIELFLVAVTALLPPGFIPFSIVLGAAGNTAGKAVIYLTGSSIIRIPLKKYYAKIDNVKQKFEAWKWGQKSFIFISAAFGLPPFYIVSISAGIIRLKAEYLYLFGFLGSLVRYSLVILFPAAVMHLFGS